MNIEINIQPNNLAAIASHDLMSIVNQVKQPNEVIGNPELNVLELIKVGGVVTPDDDKEFWENVKTAISPYYDIKLTHAKKDKPGTFEMYTLGTLYKKEEMALVLADEVVLKEGTNLDDIKTTGTYKAKTESKKPRAIKRLFSRKKKEEK